MTLYPFSCIHDHSGNKSKISALQIHSSIIYILNLTGWSVLMQIQCTQWMWVAQSKQIWSVSMRKDHQGFISSDYTDTLETVSSSGVLLGARLQLIPTLEMGTISHLIPQGPDRGTRSLLQVSLFNIRVLYSEAARRSEIYDQCSIRSMSHTWENTNSDTYQPTTYTHSLQRGWGDIGRGKEIDWCRFRQHRKGKGGRAKRWDKDNWTRMEKEGMSPASRSGLQHSREKWDERFLSHEEKKSLATHIFHLSFPFPPL